MTKIEGRKDDTLLRTYGFNAFPSLAILDASGEAITKKVDRSVGAIQAAVAAAGKFVALKAKVDAGEEYDKKAWFLAQLRLGQLTAAEAKGCAAELGLQGKEAKHVDGLILAMELDGMMRSRGAGPKVYKWWKAGRRLTADASDMHHNFLALNLANQAMQNDDAEAFRFASSRARKMQEGTLGRIKSIMPRIAKDKERFADNERVLKQIERFESRNKAQIKALEKAIADMDAFAKKIESVKKEGK